MLQKDPNKRLSAKQLKNHDFLIKNIGQFRPVDVRKIPATVGPGGMLNFNTNTNNKNQNLYETVWDIFAEPLT